MPELKSHGDSVKRQVVRSKGSALVDGISAQKHKLVPLSLPVLLSHEDTKFTFFFFCPLLPSSTSGCHGKRHPAGVLILASQPPDCEEQTRETYTLLGLKYFVIAARRD